MDLSISIESLRRASQITPLEKDILDTWDELNKCPFDRNSAKKQIVQNNINHPDIFAAIKAMPTTVSLAFNQVTECDIQYNRETT